ncbi:hypothetical protein [Novosphingobium sp.]|uniref:hypothetical protein n=1 Tax=Novosphingobium sp. TaxID=1874826 RepID=UPI001EBC8158|nr:hypothetical protein [Novosphingobium sp.]MBK9012116.1 hydrogenase [Novosphingobium sp.]
MTRKLVLLGAVLVMLGLLTGFISGSLANPRMGLAAHLEGLMNGTLLIALGAAWGHVRLSPGTERWCWWLLAYGSLANWLAVLLGAIWGAGRATMPLTAGGMQAAPWQEALVGGLLISLSFAMVAAFALVIRGVLAARNAA